MKPTDEIRAEHRIIASALSGLVYAARALDDGKDVPPELLRDELDFIRNFADRCHHRKEEAILFPALEGQLPLKHHDSVPQMLRDHEEARALIFSLSDAVDRYEAGDKAQGRKIAALSKTYYDLLIKHIRTENTTFMGLVETSLPADKKLEVAEKFEAVEEELGRDHHERYARLAGRLRKAAKKLAA